MKETVVTANRIEQPLSDLVADMSVVGRETIEAAGAGRGRCARVCRVCRWCATAAPARPPAFICAVPTRVSLPSISMACDSQSTGGASWQDIPLEAIDRIEVLRPGGGCLRL
jgi:vitamin B12 transporter